jgi:hypothetical protein
MTITSGEMQVAATAVERDGSRPTSPDASAAAVRDASPEVLRDAPPRAEDDASLLDPGDASRRPGEDASPRGLRDGSRAARADAPPAYWERRRVRLRRLAVLRVLFRPFAAARLLQGLADDAATYRMATHVAIRACVQVHYHPDWGR